MGWAGAMIPFCYIVKELIFGLEEAGQKETDSGVRELIWKARWWTVVSWLTYPVVYIIPLGFPRTAGTGGAGRALHPVRLLPLGYHLEVRCRSPDLPDHLRQVAAREGWPARLSDGLGSLQGS